ncbi:MAG: hypothetical protein IPK50_11510 [Fibrobacterota bacterium]|nr:hypothetical protein [Fibrobacterota bacterium]QQS07500.1 MAG: hypothetical protein IPK50_11510 [Fibrobacterota bacterium]
MNFSSKLLPFAWGALAFLAGCEKSQDPVAGGSDEIESRMAVDKSGRPVSGARILLVRSGDSTGKPVAINATGDNGRYPELRVPDGYYTAVLRDPGDSLGKYVDSLKITDKQAKLGTDTLLTLGRIRGVVRLRADQPIPSLTVGLVGTDILANVKANGTFQLDLVPNGIYTLGAFPRQEGYGDLFLRIQVKNGQTLTISDTLELPVTGLTAPTGLEALEDTSTGNVRIRWNQIHHPGLMGYVFEKVEDGSVIESRYLTDTSLTDSLRNYWEGRPLFGPWPARRFVYRVRTRALSGEPDSKSAALTLLVVAPDWTRKLDSLDFKASEDTSTGNVTLRWNPFLNPTLAGYVIEATEGTTSNAVPIQSGTSWTDFFQKSWESQPLQGPWKNRNVSYRLRLVSKKSGMDWRSPAINFQVAPPNWTRRIDSAHLVMEVDTARDIRRLRWTAPRVPNVTGWKAYRTVQGVKDCEAIVTNGTWNDSICPEPLHPIIDSTINNGKTTRIYSSRAWDSGNAEIRYSISPIGENRTLSPFASAVTSKRSVPLVIWRDSVECTLPAQTFFQSLGDWIVLNPWPSRPRASIDGIHWKIFPNDQAYAHNQFEAVRSGDSIWMIGMESNWRPILMNLQSDSTWKNQYISWPYIGDYSPTSPTNGQFNANIDSDGRPYVWLPFYRRSDFESYSRTFKVTILPVGFRIDTTARPPTIPTTGLNYKWIGSIGGNAGAIYQYSSNIMYMDSSAKAWILPYPPGTQSISDPGMVITFKNEIWAFRDGHLWKGKLNLPK